MYRLFSSTVLVGLCLFASHAQVLSFTSVPEGYVPGSIPLPRSFAGALAVDPSRDNILYASVGSFGDTDLVRIDLDTNGVFPVADGPFGNLAGISILSATEMVLVDNAGAPGGPPDQTIISARDANSDGDFNDLGELTELIPPILTGLFGWTGASTKVAPQNNESFIPGGSVLIQSADGNGGAEILVVTDPLNSPAFRPAGGALLTGFDYYGGLDFDEHGQLYAGAAQVVDPTSFIIVGNVFALRDLDSNGTIGPGESNLVLDGTQLPSGLADLAVDGDADGFCASGGTVVTFRRPTNPLVQTSTTSSFAGTSSFFLTALLVNSKIRPFDPHAGPVGATLVIGSGFGEQNLLTLKPDTSSSVENWTLYENGSCPD